MYQFLQLIHIKTKKWRFDNITNTFEAQNPYASYNVMKITFIPVKQFLKFWISFFLSCSLCMILEKKLLFLKLFFFFFFLIN